MDKALVEGKAINMHVVIINLPDQKLTKKSEKYWDLTWETYASGKNTDLF